MDTNFQAFGVLKTWLFGNIDMKDPPMLSPLLSGSQNCEENVHLSLWTSKLLKIYLKRKGFRVIKIMGDSFLSMLAKLLPSRCGNIGVMAIKVQNYEGSHSN